MSHAKTIDRRAVLTGGAAAGTVAALGAGKALGAEAEVAELRRLMAECRAAWDAYGDAINRRDKLWTARDPGEADAETAEQAAADRSGEAEMAVLSYPCQTMDGARLKANWMLTSAEMDDGARHEDHYVDALLWSFLDWRAS